MKIIEKGTRIVCPNCGRVLYKFKCNMSESTIIALTPDFVEPVFPQPSMPIPIFGVKCVICGENINLMEQLRSLVLKAREDK